MHSAGNTIDDVDNTENTNKILTHSYCHRAFIFTLTQVNEVFRVNRGSFKEKNRKKKMYSFIIK